METAITTCGGVVESSFLADPEPGIGLNNETRP